MILHQDKVSEDQRRRNLMGITLDDLPVPPYWLEPEEEEEENDSLIFGQ